MKSKYPCGCVVFELSSTQVYLDNLSNVYNTYMPRIVFGMVDDPAAFVAEFRDQLQAAGASSSAALFAFQRENCRPICESLRV